MEKFLFTPNFYQKLQCTSCRSLLYPPVFQCFQGHTICQDCSETLPHCPECKSLLSPSRNLSIERILNSIKLKCCFSPCTQFILLSKRIKHERLCEFNPTQFCIYPNCTWSGINLTNHLIKFHKCREFAIEGSKTIRGWNSKNWINAEWGFSIWSFPTVSIINLSYSDEYFFYLWLFDTSHKRVPIKLSLKNKSIEYKIQTASVKNQEKSLPLHISLEVLQDFLLQPAEGFEEGFKRLSIEIELLNSDFGLV